MKNYKKSGYSVPEVAQILGVTPATVRSRIERGELEALIDGVFEKGHKRKFRITKDQITNYLKQHAAYYERETVKVFLNSVADKAPTVELKPAEDGAYTVNDISELSGAWADIVNGDNTTSLKDTGLAKEESYKLLVDGRIMVCNVEKRTIKSIIDALLEDSKFAPKTITIEYGE